MFNLLPDNLKEQIISEYKLRKLTLGVIFLLFIQVSFLVFLFPSWLVSIYKERDILKQTEEMSKSSLVSNINTAVSTINSTNTKLKVLTTVLEYPKFTPFVNAILSKKTNNIQINAIMYTSTEASMATISIQGISSTRESLVSFVKNLENLGLFEKVNLPVSNLAKEKNINFFIDLTITIKNEK